MKKIFGFVIVLGILFLVFQFGVIFFKRSHSIDYEINVDRKKVEISEKYIERTGVTKAFTSADMSFRQTVGADTKSTYNPFAQKKTATTAATGNTYNVGDRVKHKVFGVGLVIKAEPMGKDTMMEISFDTVGTKTLMANFSKMEKL